jgi:hypothetical protein
MFRDPICILGFMGGPFGEGIGSLRKLGSATLWRHESLFSRSGRAFSGGGNAWAVGKLLGNFLAFWKYLLPSDWRRRTGRTIVALHF